jgi:translation initiation factor IF-1
MKSFSDIITRLKTALKVKYDKDIARLLGISQKNIGVMKVRDSIPHKEIATLCSLHRISYLWIISGDGPMMLDDQSVGGDETQVTLEPDDSSIVEQAPDPVVSGVTQESEDSPYGDLKPGDPIPEKYGLPKGAVWMPLDDLGDPIPVIGMTAAGEGGFFDNMGFPVGQGDFYIQRPFDLKDKHAYGVKIAYNNGDSMEPAYREGDVVLVSPTATVRSRDHVVLRMKDGQVMLKEIRIHDEQLELISYNPDHPKLIVKASEVESYHKVVYVKRI